MKNYNFKVSYRGGCILFSVKAASKRLAMIKADLFSGLYFRMSGPFEVSSIDYGSFPTINIHKRTGSFKGSFLRGGCQSVQKVLRLVK